MKIYCFAGPNGSGKSTIFKKIVDANEIDLKFINADDIARIEPFSNVNDYEQRNLLAAKYAEKLRNDYIDRGDSFAFETVLSTPRNLDLLKKAKKRGYEVVLIYVLTKDPKINVSRVKKRVSEGGHDVPEDKIITRYNRCMNLLPEVVETADAAYIYDNSDQYELIAIKSNEKVYALSDTKRDSEQLV